jgi:hypothetical protein
VKKKSKRRWSWLRYRKGDHAHNLIVSVQRYIHANKGTALVLGGIELIHVGPSRYKIAVPFLGIKPEKSAADE